MSNHEQEQLKKIVGKFNVEPFQNLRQEPNSVESSSNEGIIAKSKEQLEKFDPGELTRPESFDTRHYTLRSLIQDSPYEAWVGSRGEFLPIFFLEKGFIVQNAVVRIAIPSMGFGTGFLVSPSLLVTNNHVLQSKQVADIAQYEFQYQKKIDGTVAEVEIYSSAPDGVFYTNETLDYTLVELAPNPNNKLPGDRWGFLPLVQRNLAEGQNCNIIQHPSSRYKEVALSENEITEIYTNAIRYRTDTEPGSSGSPVFDNGWEIIAVHHARGDKDPENDNVWLNNEGIRIDKIISDLQQFHTLSPQGQAILQELGISSTIEESDTVIPSPQEKSKVNINIAPRDALLVIPGMSVRRVETIIEYRETIGLFTSVWDLSSLDGFPLWLVADLTSYISVM
ncbi:MAG: trypsin-like peptidase domain-containing protein [Anaerolineae bacterium]|nr:trypsin-like peptidase domain-containing protein [Anaerolineae bacterium]